MNDTTAGAISIAYCPNCGKVGEYAAVVDGVVKTIACKCGYNAPGMAVVGQRSDIAATDLVTVRRDLLAMESEIAELRNKYAEADARAELYEGLWAVETQTVSELREARDAAVLVAGVYQAQADALAEKVQAGIEYASRFGRIDAELMLAKLGGALEQEAAPMQVQCRSCHALFARRVDDTPTFDVQANPLGVVRISKTRYGYAVNCPECGAKRTFC